MTTRRSFMKKAALAAGSLSFLKFSEPLFAAELEQQVKRISKLSPVDAASDEDFWGWVKESFTVSATIINLNNGGVSPQPKVVQDAHIRNYQLCNEAPSYYMWRTLDMGREPLRAKLADLAGCSTEEIAINRNSTEGLGTIIMGLRLKAGDEVVLSSYDYPHMMDAWKQREKRDGIKLVWVDLKMPVENDDTIVNMYKAAITAKTKIVHITHIINWTGQILPAKKIAKMAHEKGCEVVVDGAHTFAHLVYTIPDLECDYYATSLHKWLNAPFGSGMLYVKKEKIKDLWPLLAADKPESDDIRKFEAPLGTRSFASEMAIGNAVDFHNIIGSQRKYDRLQYLKNYWVNKVKGLPKIKFYSSLLPQYSCALMNVGFEGWEATEIESRLFEKKKVHTVAIKFLDVNGIRVTPSVYTSTKDLDRLVEGLKEISASEPPVKK